MYDTFSSAQNCFSLAEIIERPISVSHMDLLYTHKISIIVYCYSY